MELLEFIRIIILLEDLWGVQFPWRSMRVLRCPGKVASSLDSNLG